jgi:hypothetical protein
MPGDKYVEVDHISVPKTFDNKYKTTLPKKMEKALKEAVDHSSKLTTTAPSGKDAKGLSVMGSLTVSQGDKGVLAEIEWVLSYWPANSIFAKAHTKTPWLDVRKPEKIDNDVDDAIDALIKDFATKIVKVLEQTEPQ